MQDGGSFHSRAGRIRATAGGCDKNEMQDMGGVARFGGRGVGTDRAARVREGFAGRGGSCMVRA